MAVLFLLLILTVYAEARTELIDAINCFQSPESPIRFDSIVLYGAASRGSSKCYMDPIRADYYMSIRIDVLELNGECPTFSLAEYSTIIKEEIPEDEQFPSMFIPRPSDLNTLLESNCKDFATVVGKVFFTSMPGRKLLVTFDPVASDIVNRFNITITSYFLGTSYSCPAEHFRCWNSQDRCIPDSITCDNVDNCFDGSDENNYLCTGRIGDLPLPLFVILIVVGILILLTLILGVVIYVRRRRMRQKPATECIDMTIMRGQQSAQEPLMPVVVK